MRRHGRIAASLAIALAISCSGASRRMSTLGVPHGVVEAFIEGRDMGEVARIVDETLALDPDNPLALALAGDVAYYRADFDAAMEFFSRSLASAPERGGPLADPLAEIALVSIHALGEYAPDYERRLAALHESSLPELYSRTDASYFVALEGRVRGLARAGRFEESRKLARDGGCLVDWKAAGPFGRTELLHFDEPHPPEEDVPWRSDYVLRAGEDPSPTFDARAYQCNVSIEPEEGFRGGTWYAAADVAVGRSSDYVFRLYSSHSTTVIVDGVPVLTVDRRFEDAPDIVLFRLALARGDHQVVLKLGTRSPAPGFSLMWKEASAGNPDPSREPALSSVRHGEGFTGAAPPPGPAAVIDLPEAAGDIESLIFAELALYRGDARATDRYLDRLREAHPTSSSVLPRLLTAEWNDPYAPFASRMNSVRALAERSSAKHPSLWIGHYLLAKLESNQGRTEDAIDILKEGLEAVGPFAGFYMMLADLYAYKGWIGESVASLRAAADLLGTNCMGLRQEYRIAEMFGDLDGMEEAARAISECDRTDSTLLDVLTSRQKWEEAEKEQSRLAQLFPDRPEQLLDEAMLALKLGQEGRYEDLLDRYHAIRPAEYTATMRLADLEAARGNGGQAIEMLEQARALMEGPTDDVSMTVAHLMGADYLYPFRRDPLTSIAAYEAQISGGGEPATQSVEVLDHVTHRIFPDGSSVTRYHSVRKLLTREGVEAHSEFAAPLGSTPLRLRTIKADGRILEPEDIAGKATVSFPALEPGDYTEAEWIQAEGPSLIYDGGFNLDRWYFQVLDLVLNLSEMILIAPADMDIVVDPRGAPPIAEEHVEGPLRITRWTAHRMPHRKAEPSSPDYSEFLPSLLLSRGSSWERFFEWVSDALVDGSKVSPRMEKKVESLVRDIPTGDDDARARAIFRWVEDEIEEGEGIDAPVATIFEERTGNRARLLDAMLREAGVESELWLVRSIYADHTPTDVPSFNVYSLFAVKVGDDWLVPFVDKAPYGILPYAMRGEEAVRIFPSPAREVTPGNDAFDDHVSRRLELDVMPAGRCSALLTETFHGMEAAIMRDGLRQLPESEIEKSIEGEYLAAMFSGPSLTGLELPDLDVDSESLEIRISFTLPAMPGPLPGTVALGPFLKSHLSKIWTTLPERYFPLLVDEPTDMSVEVVMRTGGNWMVFQPPASAATIDSKTGGHFEQSYEDKGGVITLKRRVILPAGRIPPEDYPDLLDFTTRVDENEGGVFILLSTSLLPPS